MTITIKQLGVTVILAAIALCFVFGTVAVRANPSFFSNTQTAAATTSITYLTPGTATTTLVYDAGAFGDSFASNGASLLIMWNGSSTVSTLNADIQYSQNGQDWFNNGMGTDIDAGIGSSSPSLANPVSITLAYASTSPDRAGFFGNAVAASSTNRIVNVDMPTRYVRAVFFVPVGSPNGALWAQFIAQKQNR